MGPLTPKLSLQLWKHDEQGEEGICHQGGPGQGHFNHHHQQHRLHSADVCPERGILGISSLALCLKHHLYSAACLRSILLFDNSSGNQWERRKGGIEDVEAGYLTCVVFMSCSGFPGQAPTAPRQLLHLCAFSFFTVLPCCIHVKQHCTGL